ncbi:unnamed protein product [Acanthoscelides obtectus]|uniref:Uncharacterized protein n=1 Tax=Acanthoscelides obtectus TaxID=200917 RepID=A0A9P0KUE3_ACAOB|nr:unnamed protein product [Acanthoscelides obtectus]CAK1641954.1 hypothetical protein AOBTE_LOCUS12753 [Acanthoscelides obtectus]
MIILASDHIIFEGKLKSCSHILDYHTHKCWRRLLSPGLSPWQILNLLGDVFLRKASRAVDLATPTCSSIWLVDICVLSAIPCKTLARVSSRYSFFRDKIPGDSDLVGEAKFLRVTLDRRLQWGLHFDSPY